MNTKRFSLRDVLTVVTGRLLTQPTQDSNGIENIYSLLSWMTGENPYTHQLGRFMKECKPYLLEWFPELSIALAANDKLQMWLDADATEAKQEGIKMWLAEIKMMQPLIADSYEVLQIPQDDHDTIDPLEELKSMVDEDKIIVVNGNAD